MLLRDPTRIEFRAEDAQEFAKQRELLAAEKERKKRDSIQPPAPRSRFSNVLT